MGLGNKISHVGNKYAAWGGSAWARPAEWLALPTLTAGEERLVGLYRVNDAANQCVAFTVTGDYTVDWGDGSSNDYAAGAKAEHTYTFGDLDPDSETSEGWRQAIISITPQAGAALTSINLTSVHSVGTANYTSWWLDICVVGAGLTSCLCGGLPSASLKPLDKMQQFSFPGTNSITNFSNMYYGCSSAQSFPAIDTSNGTIFAYMYYGCGAAQSFPYINTVNGVNFSGMYYNCGAAQSFPAIDTGNGIYFNNMYSGCGAACYLPTLNVGNGTTFNSIFANTGRIEAVVLNGAKYSFSVANNLLVHDAIVALFVGLGTAAPAQTITVSGNPGVAELTPDDIAIATGKGWTVAT